MKLAADDERTWLWLFVGGRIAATLVGAGLVAWAGFRELDSLLLLYGPLTAAVLVAVPALRRMPITWIVDFVATLGFVLLSEDWRSPFYLLWLDEPRAAGDVAAAAGAPSGWASARRSTYLAVAVIGGPVPGRLQLDLDRDARDPRVAPVHPRRRAGLRRRGAAPAVGRAVRARAARDRGRAQADRVGAARLGQAAPARRAPARHSLQGRVPDALDRTVARAAVELESAASDMDTSLAELRSPLEGRRLDAALRARARSSPGRRPRSMSRRGARAAAARRRARLPDHVARR